MEIVPNKHNFMETESITKLLIKFSLPAMLGMLVNALYNVVDRVYIGNIKGIGYLGITGVGVVFPVMILTFSFALLIGIGSGACISLKLGEKKLDEAEHFLGTATFYAVFSSLLLAIVVFTFMDKIIMTLGGSEETFFYAKSYLWYINLGTPAVIVGMTLNAAIRSDGSPKMSMVTLLLGAVVNIILDPIFIFYFDMGVKGAAIATIISQYLSAIWTVSYFRCNLSRIILHFGYIKFNFKKIKKISLLGSSAFAIQIGFSLVTYVLNSSLKKHGGDISIGAMAIIQAIITFMVMPILGINQGIQPILGYNYGAKKYSRVKETIFKAIFSATVICVIDFLIVRFFSDYFVKIFTENKDLEILSIYGLKIYTLMFPVVGFQIVSSAYFQAVGKPKMSFLISLSRQILFMIPCLLLLSNIFGLMGIWYATPVSDFLSTLITFLLVRREVNYLSKIERLAL